MATAKRIVRRSKKPVVRKTKSEQYIINKKYIGEEPEFVAGQSFDPVAHTRNLTWYNYMCSRAEAREYLVDYLTKRGRKEDLKSLRRVPDKFLPQTAAWIARMIDRGASLEERSLTFLETKLAEAFARDYSTAVDPETEDAPKDQPKEVKPSIQDRLKEKASDLIGDIEAELDGDRSKFSLYDYMTKRELPAAYASKVAEYYRPIADEVGQAALGKDKELAEGYRSYSKKELRELADFYKTLVQDAERFGENKKKTRAPRKPKPMSIEKKLKNFKYQLEDTNRKIASVSPDKIVGAQELWCFNTKYSTLTVFRAAGPAGLDVNRSSIVKYDEQTSVTKRVGRKADHFIERVRSGGKIVLRKLMEEAKGNPIKLQERINENTVLLRVIT